MRRTDEVAIDFAGGGPSLLRPERDELTWAVQERITEESPWLCVMRGGPDSQLYAQAYRHGPDRWQVEHRHGSSGEHYQAVGNQTWAVTEQILWGWIAAERGWRDLVAWRKLEFPARQVAIAYEPHARTRWIGTHEGGQFFGDVTDAPGPEGGGMALLHLFDAEGNHLATEFRPAADWHAAEPELAALLAGLSAVAYRAIRIRPFEVQAHGGRWGLFDETAGRDGFEHYELRPQQLGFAAPFNGSYST